MTLDIHLFRLEKGGNPNLVRESQRRRFADPELVDRVINLDKAWRTAQHDLEQLKRSIGLCSKLIARQKKQKKASTAPDEEVAPTPSDFSPPDSLLKACLTGKLLMG